MRKILKNKNILPILVKFSNVIWVEFLSISIGSFPAIRISGHVNVLLHDGDSSVPVGAQVNFIVQIPSQKILIIYVW